MNGELNCVCEVCCDPLVGGEPSPKAIKALTSEIKKANIVPGEYAAEQCANWILRTFDLAPRGTLQAFKAAIAKLARENPAQEH